MYDTTDDFSYEGYFEIEVDSTPRNAVGIDVYHVPLVGEKYLFSGSYPHTEGHHYLVRTNIDDPCDSIETHIVDDQENEACAMGVAVDDDTGLVYITVFAYPTPIVRQLRVYDIDLNLKRVYSLDSNPADIVVSGEIGYGKPFKITIDDDIENCVSPCGGQITYEICHEYQWEGYTNIEPNYFDSITVYDNLPTEVVFDSATGNYNLDGSTLTWDIDPNIYEPDCYQVTVEVNSNVIPGGTFKNEVEIVSPKDDRDYSNHEDIFTDVCLCNSCGEIIYVDVDAEGDEDGTSWEDAFNDLQDALGVAYACDEIWVADGTYTPSDSFDPCAAFYLPNHVPIYGGFSGGQDGETQRHERNWMTNKTILSGTIESDNVNYVVKVMDNVKAAVLDGFIIKNGDLGGIYCDGDNLLVEHNEILDNETGIYVNDAGNLMIRNDCIYDNTKGIHVDDPNGVSVNFCTIAHNSGYAIWNEENEPNDPMVTNSILWSNNSNGQQFYQCYLNFCCYYDPGSNYSDPDDDGNITCDPDFEDAPNRDYHLSSDSDCIGLGDPDSDYSGLRDMDKEFRLIGDRVDMGADEVCEDSYTSPADINNDDIVDILDFEMVATNWLRDDCESPDWCDGADFIPEAPAGPDGSVDMDDFIVFAGDWLWMTCDKMTEYGNSYSIGLDSLIMMGLMTGGGSMMESMAMSSVAISSGFDDLPLDEQISQLEDIQVWLENLWENDESVRNEIDEYDWNDFMKSLDKIIKDMEKLL
ncbi:MAG: right-handed parallel beta-helix repeat-containing protein [Sedimentisphaerales bacterium]|nr:right-handed parallel beta-helix repeat-containing protein [Sedimentisphaerales bacterium]